MKKKLLLLLLFIYSSVVFAQQTLKVKVSDKASGKPLEGSTIYLPEYRKTSQSDSNGEFVFTELGTAVIKIQVTHVGYKSIVVTKDLSENSSVDIDLEPSSTELEEVLITSNSSELPDKIPFSANSVSQQEIRKYSSPSVMGNLSYQPGIDKITIGNGIGKPVIRGLSFNRIMLYSQGTRIENQQWDDHHDLGLTDIGIDNVEIVRGPAALIYGSDAMGGALIFVDEKMSPVGTSTGDANLGFSSNTLGINADVGVKSSNANGVFYGVRIGGQSHTSYVQGEGEEENPNSGEEEEEFAANSKFMNTAGKANVGISKKWGVSKLSYSFFNQQIGIIEDESKVATPPVNEEEEQRDREMEAPYQDVISNIVSLENTVLTGKSKINVNVAYQLNNRKEFEPLPDKQKELAIGLKLNATTYDVKWTSNADKEFGYTVGSQGTFIKSTNNGMEALVPDAEVNDIAGFGLLRYDHEKLNLLGGVRYDARHIELESYEPGGLEADTFILQSTGDTINEPETELEKDYSPVSFSLGAVYHVNEKFAIKINGATGFSAPNYAELGTYGKHEGTYRFERGNVNLKVEQNLEGDLGFIWENEFVTINVGGFYNKVKDYTYIQNTGDTMIRVTPDGTDTLPLYDYVQGDAKITGGELSFDIHPKSAQWLDVKITDAVMRGTLDAGGNLPYIPANKLIGEVRLNKKKAWIFSESYLSFIVSNYMQQKNVAAYELSTDGYTLLDFHAGGNFKLGKQTLSLDLFCTNLLNTGYYNQLSLVKYIGVRDMGRNIGLQLHIPFGI
jgi:iron complex outermembrane receptor protein